MGNYLGHQHMKQSSDLKAKVAFQSEVLVATLQYP